jgi:hypothetical protein
MIAEKPRVLKSTLPLYLAELQYIRTRAHTRTVHLDGIDFLFPVHGRNRVFRLETKRQETQNGDQ